MADLTEQLFNAVDILIGKRLESVKFDETVGATVTDIGNADQGEYLVSTGNATFKAYSTETRYHINDAVLVTIPQGNYDNQKMIIGKQVDDMNTPIIYTSPFETIIDITGNLVSQKNSWSYWANDPENYVLKENEAKYQQGNGASIEIGNVWSSGKQAIFYKGHTLIGIKAQFSTWLSEYDIARGDYGLLVEIVFKDEVTNSEFRHYITFDSSEFFGDIYNFETYYTQEQVFDISEYAEYPIVGIRISPYQRDNFITITGERLTTPSLTGFTPTNPNIFIKDVYCCLGAYASGFKTDTAELVSDSPLTYYKERKKTTAELNDEVIRTYDSAESELRVIGEKNVKTVIQRGYQIPNDTFDANDNDVTKRQKAREYFTAHEGGSIPGFIATTGSAGPYSAGWTIRYTCHWRQNENSKNILLRWIHKDNKTGIIKPVEEKSFPEGYRIQWYRFQLGAKSPDGFAGAHWVRYYGCKSAADEDTGNWCITQEEYDSIQADPQLTDEVKAAADLATNNLLIDFQPNVNLEYERLKAIILKEEQGTSSGQNVPIQRLVAISNILEFTNDSEVRSKATIIDANALSIRFEDDEKGHYFLYDEGGDIGTNEDTEVRILTAVFDEDEHDVDLKNPLNVAECSSIVWTFPEQDGNTMIVPMTTIDTDADAAPEEGSVFTNKGNQVGFTIKNHLNHTATNNTIRLDIVKDGQNYSAQVQPIFGTAGTNGSDYTVILQWRDDKNALNLSKGFYDDDEKHHTLIGDIAIYDQAGNVQAWPQGSTVECTWLVAATATNGYPPGPTIVEEEDNNIYYPVFEDKDQERLQSSWFNNNWQSSNAQQKAILEKYYFYTETDDNENDVKPESKIAIYDLKDKTFKDNAYIKVFSGRYMKTFDTTINNDTTYYKLNSGNTDMELFTPTDNSQLQDCYEKVQYIYQQSTADTRKRKLIFQQINVETPNLDEETGKFIPIEEDSNFINKNNYQNKKYYYSNKRKYFVNYDNVFILDPWDNFQEAETYYIPQWIEPTLYDENDVQLTKSVSQVSASNPLPYVTITASLNDDADNNTYNTLATKLLNSIYILQITVNNFGDFPLVTYYPIPMKYGEQRGNNNQQQIFSVDYIEGPDRVRYGSSGETDYNKNPYKISTRQWDVNTGKFIKKRHGYAEDPSENIEILDGYWRLIVGNQNDLRNFTDDNFSPELVETKTKPNYSNSGTNQFDTPILRPVGTYIPGALPYTVQFCRVIGNEQMTILWSQPILVYQNKYPSRTLNKWNGKDILTDNDTGTITASGFAAGKKEDDNSFTGVIIGDWSRSKVDACISKNTGLYGFNHGAMSYAFKDDGTGFIGKDGKGRIMFNGTSSQIYSSNWKGNDNLGMLLDLDDGVIRLHSKVEDTKLMTDYAINDEHILKTFFDILNNLYSGTQATVSGIWQIRDVHIETAELQQDTLKPYQDNTAYYIIKSVKKSECPKAYSVATHQYKYFYLLEGSTTYQEVSRAEWESADFSESIYTITNLDSIKDLYTFEWSGGTGNFSRYFNRLYQYDLQGNGVGIWELVTKAGNNRFEYNSEKLYRFNNVVVPSGRESFHYITLSAAESIYPLAIGDVFPSSKRSFRVRWDGKTYITDGEFTGTINARSGNITGTLTVTGTLTGGNIDGANISGGIISGSQIIAGYLQADTGNIAGWEMSASGLRCGHTILDAVDGITTNLVTLKNSLNNTQVEGSFGVMEGYNGDNGTTILGTRVKTEGISSVIEVEEAEMIESGSGENTTYSLNRSKGGNIRLSGVRFGRDNNGNITSATGSAVLCRSIYLQGAEIVLGVGGSSGEDEQGNTLWNAAPLALYYKGPTENPTLDYWEIHCGIPAARQYGFYAKFA